MTIRDLAVKYKIPLMNMKHAIFRNREKLEDLGCKPFGRIWDINEAGEKYLRENFHTMKDRVETLGIK
jgi:hypothetical protein